MFYSNLHARFQDIYNIVNPSFHYHEEAGKYKVILKNTGYISLKAEGFRLFLPKLVKDYSLELLRVSSIGHFDGYLSNSQNINKKNILNIASSDLNYYLTDYNTKNQRQLTHVLNNKIIPYSSATSLIIEAYSIPFSISKNLDKWLYFRFKKLDNNPLKELSYTLTMTFDKNEIDNYVRKELKQESNVNQRHSYIQTYLDNLTKKKTIVEKKYIKKTVSRKTVLKKVVKKKSKKKSRYYLDIKRIDNYLTIPNVLNTKESLLKALSNNKYKDHFDEFNFNLSIYYLKTNKRINRKKAYLHLKKSKIKEAYFNLGIFYYIGLYVKENDKTAYKYFKQSSKLGFNRASNNRNIMEEYKVGVL